VVGVAVGQLCNFLGTLVATVMLALPNSGGWGIVLTILFIAPAIGFIFGFFVSGGGIPVGAAALMAPTHRRVVAIVAATLVIAASVVGALLNIANGGANLGGLVMVIANIGGAIYAATQFAASGAGQGSP